MMVYSVNFTVKLFNSNSRSAGRHVRVEQFDLALEPNRWSFKQILFALQSWKVWVEDSDFKFIIRTDSVLKKQAKF